MAWGCSDGVDMSFGQAGGNVRPSLKAAAEQARPCSIQRWRESLCSSQRPWIVAPWTWEPSDALRPARVVRTAAQENHVADLQNVAQLGAYAAQVSDRRWVSLRTTGTLGGCN